MAQRHSQTGREPTAVSLCIRMLASVFMCYGIFTVVDIIVITKTCCYHDT